MDDITKNQHDFIINKLKLTPLNHIDKVLEEVLELKEAIKKSPLSKEVFEELSDVYFALGTLTRLLYLDEKDLFLYQKIKHYLREIFDYSYSDKVYPNGFSKEDEQAFIEAVIPLVKAGNDISISIDLVKDIFNKLKTN